MLQGKDVQRLDPVMLRLLIRTISLLLAAETIEDLKALRSTGYKFYDGFHQVNVGGNWRLWFTVSDRGSIVLEAFDEGNH
jgi:plasmid maintenance system killer protein